MVPILAVAVDTDVSSPEMVSRDYHADKSLVPVAGGLLGGSVPGRIAVLSMLRTRHSKDTGITCPGRNEVMILQYFPFH